MALVKYPGLKNFVISNAQAYEIEELYKIAVTRFDYESDLKTFRGYVKKRVAKSEEKHNNLKASVVNIDNKQFNLETDFLSLLKDQGAVDLIQLCNQINCPPKVVEDLIQTYRHKGFEILVNNNNIRLSKDLTIKPEKITEPLGDTEIVFAATSDLHFGSNHCQITALNEFTEECRKEGVKHIMCSGDIFSGYKVYPGHEMDIYAGNVDLQVETATVNLPTGFEWYMLGGNHDYSFLKRGGCNAMMALQANRPDCHYLGFDEADVPILPGVDAKLWHPAGGVPYSVSYRMQKGVEQLAYAELSSIVKGVKDKPTTRFVLVGHLHVQMQCMFGSVFGAQVGCFEGQTSYLLRKGLVPAIGAYIIKATLDKNGMLKAHDTKFYQYPEIENDWQNYNHRMPQKVGVKNPIFG